MKPALTAEEWASWEEGWHYNKPTFLGAVHHARGGEGSAHLEAREWYYHALAALCLYEHEHGFTMEDAERHRSYAESLRQRGEPTAEIEAWHESMAARIQALLPEPE